MTWVDPSPANLIRVFEHLRTLLDILYDYVPRQVAEALSSSGEVYYTWQEDTLMFTDLAGFTSLVATHATAGRTGAETLLGILNTYFTEMIDIISKSGGTILEFTGDALLVQFSTVQRQKDTVQAVHAGLRMQRAMVHFADIATMQEDTISLGMRLGIHAGRFLTADIGTPRRMEHVLLGSAVQRTKQAEGAGQVGRVCLTESAYVRVREQFRVESSELGYVPDEEVHLVTTFSRVFALINAVVEARGGVLKHVTYHLVGSDIVIYFGVPYAHTDDPLRAADAALAIWDIITSLTPLTVQGKPVPVTCKIGLARGQAFAAEIGRPREMREFNVIGDVVNTAARLMGYAAENQILLTEAVYQIISRYFDCVALAPVCFKGKTTPTPIFALYGRR